MLLFISGKILQNIQNTQLLAASPQQRLAPLRGPLTVPFPMNNRPLHQELLYKASALSLQLFNIPECWSDRVLNRQPKNTYTEGWIFDCLYFHSFFTVDTGILMRYKSFFSKLFSRAKEKVNFLRFNRTTLWSIVKFFLKLLFLNKAWENSFVWHPGG